MQHNSRFTQDGLADHLMEPLSQATSEPAYLIDDVARNEWRRITLAFFVENGLPLTHQALLAGYCNAVARAIRAEQMLAQDGGYYETTTRKGNVIHRRHPAAQDAERSWAAARQFAKQLGITGRSQRGGQAAGYGRRSVFK